MHSHNEEGVTWREKETGIEEKRWREMEREREREGRERAFVLIQKQSHLLGINTFVFVIFLKDWSKCALLVINTFVFVTFLKNWSNMLF